MPTSGENFIAIDRTRKKTLLRRSRNTGMASEKLYRNTLRSQPVRVRSKTENLKSVEQSIASSGDCNVIMSRNVYHVTHVLANHIR